MAAQRVPYVSPEDYLAAEREADHKSEYLAGEVFAMAGASPEHTLIAFSLTATVGQHIAGGPCRGHTSDMKVQAGSMFSYPDLTVVCGEAIYADQHRHVLTNPTLIVEVLSPSTEGFDRGEKWARYQTIESLREYVLVSQHAPAIETFVRTDAGSWAYTRWEGLDAVARLASIDCAVPLADVYRGVEWPVPNGPVEAPSTSEQP